MPKKPLLVTRQETTSTTSTETLNKGSKLSFAEMDSNFLELQAGTLGIVGDDSTGINVGHGDTVKIAGGTGITTAVTGDTVTITGVSQAQGITVVGDDSTGTQISDGETLKIAGGTGITTAMSGDTLTITGSAGGGNLGNLEVVDVKLAPITTNSNLELYGNGTGIVDLNNEIAIRAGAIISPVDTTNDDLTLSTYSANNNIILDAGSGNATGGDVIFKGATTAGTGTGVSARIGAGGGSLAIYADGLDTANTSSIILRNDADSAGADNIDLDLNGSGTFNVTGGAGVAVTGDLAVSTGTISTDGIDINDNKISTNRSNDNLLIDANGTGHIFLGDGAVSANSSSNSNGRADRGTTRSYYVELDASTQTGSADRHYANTDNTRFKLTGSSTDSDARWQKHSTLEIDLNGTTHTATSSFNSTGARNFQSAKIENTSATAGSLANANAGQFALELYAQSGDVTVTDAVSNNAVLDSSFGGSGNVAVTNYYGYKTMASVGSNTTVTNYYGLHLKDLSGESGTITNDYGVYADNDDQLSKLGGITFQSGDITTPAITIADNKISANRSNDDLELSASGTGMIVLGGQSSDLQARQRWGAARYYEETVDASTMTTNDDQRRAHHDQATFTLSASSSNSNSRFRKTQAIDLDMAGYDLTATSSSFLSRGVQNSIFTQIDNTSGTTASTLANAQGVQVGLELYDTGGQGLTINDCVGNSTYLEVRSGVTINRGYGYRAVASNGGTIDNFYAFEASDIGTDATNHYAFYSENADYLSAIGKLESYREKINALTSSSTITVDCSLAPVHTVTLGTNTGFVVSNLGTGQTVTIIITQDGTGTRTATFGTDGSTAVKFPGGAPTLSTGNGDIDVVTIFNDGTNYLGNIAQDYS